MNRQNISRREEETQRRSTRNYPRHLSVTLRRTRWSRSSVNSFSRKHIGRWLLPVLNRQKSEVNRNISQKPVAQQYQQSAATSVAIIREEGLDVKRDSTTKDVVEGGFVIFRRTIREFDISFSNIFFLL